MAQQRSSEVGRTIIYSMSHTHFYILPVATQIKKRNYDRQ